MSPAVPKQGARRGILVIISSPSGAGKSTLCRELIAEFPELRFSVSYTTRPPRKGEEDGVHYHFVTPEAFEQMVAGGEFAEHALVHGNRYGTSRAVVENALAAGRDVVFDVDWQGGRALSGQWPNDALTIFILPPDLVILEQRLRRRATDTDEVIRRRLATAIEELGHHHEYQYRVVNDDLKDAYATLRALYLHRRDGDDTAALAARVEIAAGPAARRHADDLVSAGKQRGGGGQHD
jgi:guanylate kinase